MNGRFYAIGAQHARTAQQYYSSSSSSTYCSSRCCQRAFFNMPDRPTPTHYTYMPMIGELDEAKGYSGCQEKGWTGVVTKKRHADKKQTQK